MLSFQQQKQVCVAEAKIPPRLLKNFQLFHQVSQDLQHLFDIISGGLRGL